jgi:hypothetical protein
MPTSKPLIPDQIIIERDDGFFHIGIGDDAAGPFETRAFAQAVASVQAREDDPRLLTRPVLK